MNDAAIPSEEQIADNDAPLQKVATSPLEAAVLQEVRLRTANLEIALAQSQRMCRELADERNRQRLGHQQIERAERRYKDIASKYVEAQQSIRDLEDEVNTVVAERNELNRAFDSLIKKGIIKEIPSTKDPYDDLTPA